MIIWIRKILLHVMRVTKKKGGIGKKPTVPRPTPPKGQGTPNKSSKKMH